MALKDYLNRYFFGRATNNEIFAEYHRRTASKAEWKRTADILSAKEIRDWRVAVATATAPDDPRREPLMRFYRSMMLDSHLMSVVDTRILRVQRSSFMVADDNGNKNEELTDLLRRPWFEELIRLVLMSRFQGTTLIEMFDLDPDTMEMATVTEIPQSNFIASKGIVIKEPYDTKGVSFVDEPLGNYYLQVGGSFDLGMFHQLAMPVIAKKLSLGSWMSYIDKYGVPPIFFITDRMDTARRDELFEMGQNIRQNLFAVLQGNEKIETPSLSDTNAHQTFISLIDEFCNKEISKRVLGGTSTTDEKSFVGSAEVQERVAADRYEADKQLFGYIFNAKIRQRLVQISPVYKDFERHKLVWNNQETLDINGYIDAISKLSSSYEFDIDEIRMRTGLPVTAIRQTTSFFGDGSQNDGEEQVKKKDNTQAIAYTTLPSAAASDPSIDEIAEQVYRDNITPEKLHRALVLKYYTGLSSATQKGWGGGYYTDPTTRKFRENLLAFAGAKTFSLIKEIEALKVGGISKEKLLGLAQKRGFLYGDIWQKTEEKFAANSASSAYQFGQFRKDSDIYPNLRFVTMQDSHVRDSHAANEGIVKPVDEWTVMPPLDYNCRCYLEQTTDPPNDRKLSQYNDTIAGNAALSERIFKDTHPYNKRVLSLPIDTIHSISETIQLTKQYVPYNATIKVGERTIYINDFADYNDLVDNIEAAKRIAPALDKDIYIRHHTDGGKLKGGTNAEFGIGKSNILGDLKTYNGKGKLEKFLNNRLRDCNTQKCKYAVLDITAYNQQDVADKIRSKLRGELKGTLNTNIKSVVIIKGDNVGIISRDDISGNKFDNLMQNLKIK